MTNNETIKRADELTDRDLRLTTEGYAEVVAVSAVGTDRTRITWKIERHGKVRRFSELAANNYTYTIESH
jgi:hypothetical protein